MEDRKHALLSPSASERWLSCPGSVALCAKLPTPASSKYADEGTAAHELARRAITENKPCSEYLGQTIFVGGETGFVVDAQMAEDTQVYVDHVKGYLGWKHWAVETKLDLSLFVKDCFGSADFWAYDPVTRRLKVADLKFGKGVIVEPYQNSQGMMYALGVVVFVMTKLFKDKAFTAVNALIGEIDITIVQPRAFHEEGPVRTWQTTGIDLMFWARAVLMPGAVRTESINATLEAGDYCRFCPALAVCPENAKNALAIAQTGFKDPVLPSPEALTPEQIVQVLKAADLFNAWADQVKAYAQYKLEQGEQLPGFKLVEKRANRKWIEESIAAAALEKFLGDDAYEKSLLSIAKAEKELKRRGISADAALQGLWEKPEAGVSIAPESDKRPSVAPGIEVRSGFLEGVEFLQ